MKRMLMLLVILGALPGAAPAGELERGLKSRWLGAWVVLTVESYSDCQGMYTNNRINGNLVKSRGHHAFGAGELAKLDKLDPKRSRVDVHLSLVEPLLVSYQDGPFTLYNEVACRIELEIEVPRELVQRRDVDAIESSLALALERYPTRGEAERSRSWNGREVEPYPENYETTLAEHAVWKANQFNASIEAKLDQASQETYRVTDRLSADPDYLEGFASGVEDGRSAGLDSCPDLLAVSFLRPPRRPSGPGHVASDSEARHDRGYRDGKNLVYALEMMRGLPGCFVPVPDLQASRAMARE